MKTHIFDIETAPDIDRANRFAKPFPPFDPNEVKLGNIKDPAKIKAKLELEADKHALAKEAHEAAIVDKAALNPATSKIVAIGIHLEDEKQPTLYTGNEFQILVNFWDLFDHYSNDVWAFFSGSNTKAAFDPMHIIRRSWANGLHTGQAVSHKGYLNAAFVDLANIYLVGADYPSYISVDRCAEELGVIGNPTDIGTVRSKKELEEEYGVTGANYWEFADSLASPQQQAIAKEYLTNDLRLERAIANKIL